MDGCCTYGRITRVVQKALGVLLLFCLPFIQASANDIQITNLTVHPYNGGNGEVEFDITWQNSWRVATEPYNWDAAWVFCKLRKNGGDWTHLKLSTSGHTIPSTPQAITTSLGLVDTGATYNASTNPAVGIFMYRTNDGFGTFTANDVRLQWSYSDNGVSSGDVVEIRVVGIEMVYIPAGAFYAGDGPSAPSTNAFRQKESSDNDPWYISSESAITTTSGNTGDFYYPGPGDAANSVFTISAAFPKGYGAVYMMKGELSQGQWVTFFNTLTSTQKIIRDITSNKGDGLADRNNVSWTSGDATLPDRGGGATYSGVALNWLYFPDLAAYADWSGLRPMSELEYEKAGRGPNAPVSGEYAWGSTSVTAATSVSNDGLPSERGQAGSNIRLSGGPLRVGSFAKGVNSRVSSGAGFYGVFELSGNAYDLCVSVGNSAGRAFEGRYHGNGSLDSSGNPNVSTWPGTNASGSGFRGGYWADNAGFRLSNRVGAAYTLANRYHWLGGRGVRTAP
jgi:hypothetical protein